MPHKTYQLLRNERLPVMETFYDMDIKNDLFKENTY